ncbi:rab geranylgeranyl transferase escort protein-like protein [Massariosphaeria phaeospora]|uniref:Rab proteins geranylgeranyltransferase n=1 Tax=Massariosphaeria phaeospora TaxID=100035 RepID=A0A7C8I887_9PLEO|nr:rab geranylgeranyl transferase escort protein-like protein [Massariosphaeria phaeospora]
METLDNTTWDVLIVGTGLRQSLLALALSRSGKKILHIDQNEYYGGAEAAFSLQEAEEWAGHLNKDQPFSNISIHKPEPTGSDLSAPSLSFSRAYSLALAPQLVYARSSLLQYLVSSKVYRQLEFLAVGSWWVYSPETDTTTSSVDEARPPHGKLLKVPNGREDVFQDQVLDFKAKRALMKFLRFIAEYEEQPEVWEEHRSQPFPTFLSEQFKVPTTLHAPLLALTLSAASSGQTTTEYALPRIARHLRSIGVFGAGFGSVIPKWGGMSEIAQVACRACAVGGGVYILGKGLSTANEEPNTTSADGVKIHLKDGELVTTQWVVGEQSARPSPDDAHSRFITVASSPLTPLFPPITEEAPSPAAAVIVFPSGSLKFDREPEGLLYASTSLSGEEGYELLKQATETLLSTVEVSPAPTILWSIQYQQQSGPAEQSRGTTPYDLQFAPASLDLAFDDSIIRDVKEVWQKIMGDGAVEFLVFDDRESYADEDEA